MCELLKGRHVARWKAVTCHAHSKERKERLWPRRFSLWISVAMKPLHSSKPKVAGASRSQAVVAEQDSVFVWVFLFSSNARFFHFSAAAQAGMPMLHLVPLPSSEKV